MTINKCSCGGDAAKNYHAQYAPLIFCLRCRKEFLFRRGQEAEAIAKWNKQQAEKAL